MAGRAVLDGGPSTSATSQAEAEDEFPRAHAQSPGARATDHLRVPLLREGAPIGADRAPPHETVPFTDKQIALLETFADQAVIAIENARLFRSCRSATAS